MASDGWGKQSQVVRGIEDFAVGAITVELESKKIPGNTSQNSAQWLERWKIFFYIFNFMTFEQTFDDIWKLNSQKYEKNCLKMPNF